MSLSDLIPSAFLKVSSLQRVNDDKMFLMIGKSSVSHLSFTHHVSVVCTTGVGGRTRGQLPNRAVVSEVFDIDEVGKVKELYLLPKHAFVV